MFVVWFSVTKQSFEKWFWLSPLIINTHVTRYLLVLKFNVTLARTMRLVILNVLNGNSFKMIGACNFMTANETPDLMWMGLPYKTIAKFIVHSILIKVKNRTKIRNRYSQAPHLTQDTNGNGQRHNWTSQTRAKRSAFSKQVTTRHQQTGVHENITKQDKNNINDPRSPIF